MKNFASLRLIILALGLTVVATTTSGCIVHSRGRSRGGVHGHGSHQHCHSRGGKHHKQQCHAHPHGDGHH